VKQLNPKLVTVIRNFLKGARLAKFDASVEVLNKSIAEGQWIKRGSVKADSGFYQGLGKIRYDYFTFKRGSDDAAALYFCLQWGQPFKLRGKNLDLGIKTSYKLAADQGTPINLPENVVRAWVELCEEKRAAADELHAARPKPVLTKIGLSPKVTKTLKEMDLDIDISSIRMPPISYYMDQARDPKTQQLLFNHDGSKKMERVYYVKWPAKTKFDATRFYQPGTCEACGKYIPSNMFVPILAEDNKTKKSVGMWLGCDCSRNIFGVKDIGMRRNNDGKK